MCVTTMISIPIRILGLCQPIRFILWSVLGLAGRQMEVVNPYCYCPPRWTVFNLGFDSQQRQHTMHSICTKKYSKRTETEIPYSFECNCIKAPLEGVEKSRTFKHVLLTVSKWQYKCSIFTLAMYKLSACPGKQELLCTSFSSLN
jgi:hypothetical protein